MSWNGSSKCLAPAPSPAENARPSSRSHSRRGIIAATVLLILLAGGVTAFLLMRNEGELEGDETAPGTVRTIPDRGTNVSAAVRMPDLGEFNRGKFAKFQALTNETAVAAAPVSPVDMNSTVVTMACDTTFSDPVERIMVDLLVTVPGDMPPIIPDINDADEARLKAVIGKTYAVSKDDDPDTAFRKELVNEAKAELSRYFNEGGKANDFLRYYHDELLNMFEFREECRKTVFKSIREEEPSLAADYYRQINNKLEEKGIKPVELNPRQRARIGIGDDK